MKVVILCGGKGTRLHDISPKPMAIVNGKPILWHIMNRYSYYGFNDFILLTGFMSEKIKEYFVQYAWKNYDFTLDLGCHEKPITLLQQSENWRITFLDTGENTMTGGRIKRAEPLIEEDTFLLTYGDALSNVPIDKLLMFHKEKNKLATLTGIRRNSQFGVLSVEDGVATAFEEKPELKGLINGGYFVLNRGIFERITTGDSCIFEKETLVSLALENSLAVYPHEGLWTAIDTYKDLLEVNNNWATVEKELYNNK